MSITTTYSRRVRLALYDRRVPDTKTRLEDTLVRGYRQLALETPVRPRDALLRALDVAFSAALIILTFPLALLIAFLVLVTSGAPVL